MTEEQELTKNVERLLAKDERRRDSIVKYARKNHKAFINLVWRVVCMIKKRDYTKYAKEMRYIAENIGEEEGKNEFRDVSKRLKNTRNGFALYLKAVLSTRDYYTIADAAGISRGELEKIVDARSAVVYFQEGVKADTLYSPKDAVSNTIWGGLKPDTIIPVKTLTDKNGKKYGAVLKYIQCKDKNQQIDIAYTKYGEYERRVCDAIATLSQETVPITLSSLQIYRVMSQNPHAKLTQKNAKEIETAMVNINRTEVTIVTDPSGDKELWEIATNGKLNPEKDRYRKVKPKYYGSMVIFSSDSSGEFGGTLDRWTVYERPILYIYAHDKKQVASTPIEKIDVKVKRVKDVQSLQGYLDRRIDTMKKDRKQSRLILWENLYEIDGTAAGKNPDTVKAKQLRTRNKVIKLLDERKETGQIKNYAYKDKKHMKQIGKRFKYHSIGIIL